MARHREQGEEGLNPQSKAPHRSPTRVPTAVEEEIVALRKELTDLGVDAGPHVGLEAGAHAGNDLFTGDMAELAARLPGDRIGVCEHLLLVAPEFFCIAAQSLEFLPALA